MLLGNYSVIQKSAGTFRSGTSVSECRSNFNKGNSNKNKFVSTTYLKRSSVPSGTEPPYSIQIAQKGGGLATFNTIIGTGTSTGNLAMGLYAQGALTGSGTVSAADLSMIVQCAAALVGAGSLAGDATVTVSLASPLAGSGAIVADLALIQAAEMSSSLAGSGNLTASLQLLAGMTSAIVGAGDVSCAMTGTCDMDSDITSAGDLVTAASCAQAVWSALAASFAEAGTMGELLNVAGSGGMDPALVQKIEELWTLAGLDISNPLSVSTTERIAGTITQTIDEDAGIVTVTRD